MTSRPIGLGDITDPKRAEAALHQSEQRYRTLVEVTSDWIWEWIQTADTPSATGRLRISGYPPEDIIGKTPLISCRPMRRQANSSFANRCSQKPFSCLENINLTSRREVVLETSGVPILDEKVHSEAQRHRSRHHRRRSSRKISGRRGRG